MRSKEDPDNNQMWRSLAAVPYTSEIWAKKYPTLAGIVTDFDKADDPRFPVYPTGTVDLIIITASGFTAITCFITASTELVSK